MNTMSIGSKIETKIDTKWTKINAKSLKLVKIRPTLCPRISRTKCDRHKLIISAERGGQLDHTMETKSDRQSQKWGSSPWKLPTMPKYGSTHPRP